MKRNLPSLSLRSTRVRLLAASYDDAVMPTVAGGPADRHDSRLLLHGELWDYGSYQELARALVRLEVRHRRDFHALYLGKRFDGQPTAQCEALTLVTGLMPPAIFVPQDVAENAGYLPGDAASWRMPEAETRHRWSRRPTPGVRSPQAVEARPHTAVRHEGLTLSAASGRA